MKIFSIINVKRGAAVLLPLVLLAGCGQSQQELMARDRLAKVQTSYNEASANPEVAANAPVALLDASRMLKAAGDTTDYNQMEQLTYLGERKTQTAVAIAEKKVAENKIEKLSRESSSILLAKRERELNLSRSQADARLRELESLQLEADKRARELESARQKAVTAAGENMQARQLAETQVRDAEQARQLAEAKVREAEQARLLAEEQTRQAQLLAEAKHGEAEEARRQAEAKALEAENVKAESARIIRELAELKANQTERGIVLTVGDVLFETNKANLSPRAEKSIVKLAEFLKKNSNRNLLIEGHTDSVGSDEYNLVLSNKRADSVKENLLAKGVAPERITTKGYGEKYPVAPNSTKIGRQNNRRVEVVILNEGVKPESVMR